MDKTNRIDTGKTMIICQIKSDFSSKEIDEQLQRYKKETKNKENTNKSFANKVHLLSRFNIKK